MIKIINYRRSRLMNNMFDLVDKLDKLKGILNDKDFEDQKHEIEQAINETDLEIKKLQEELRCKI